VEYLEGTFTQEEKLIESEILIAEEKLSRARETAKFSERLAALGFQSALQLKADQFAVEQAGVELELAKGRLRTLQEITKKKMLIQLDADIETAKAQVEATTNSYDEELKKLAEFEHQINKCVIYAPQGGVVVHANKTSSRGNAEFVVEAGALVREQQVIIRLPDPTKMQVRANINEARVPMIKEGMPVAIRIGALEDMILQGMVTKVNKYAEPTSWFSSQVKEYATYVQILNPPVGIRNGMTAEVRIFVERRSNELQVPVQALYEHKAHLFCLVKKGPAYETREITIGNSNDKTVMILDGLEEGEEIVLNPRTHRGLLNLPDLPDPPRDVPPQFLADSFTSGELVAGSPSDTTPVTAEGVEKNAKGSLGELMDRADTNRDGSLSAPEIASLPEYQQRLLQRGDANSDGGLDTAELAALVAEFDKPSSDANVGGGE
jgi:HlyD family secretion protein